MLLILDENKEIVKSISVDSTNGTHYFNDSHTEKVIDFDSTYEFSVSTDDESSKYLTGGNYVMLQDLDDDSLLFKIIEVQDIRDDNSSKPQKRIFCENVFIFDLNNVIVTDRAFSNSNIGPALTYVLGGSGWIPQDTENVGAVANLEFSGYITAQEALHQICTAFDCEVKFYVKTFQGRIVGYYCKVAKQFGDNEGVRIESGTGIKGITRKVLFTNIKTALIPLGATQADGTQLNISSVNGGLNYIYNDEANEQYNPSGTGYLMTKIVNENITNAAALKQWGTLELRKLSSPSYQYEANILMLEQVYGFEAHRIRKGSFVRIVDLEMSPPITVQARVIELNICYSDMSKSTCVVGDFIDINSATPAIINQLRENAKVSTNANKVASIASNKAETAQQIASSAESVANDANTNATDAKQVANDAKDSAVTAIDTANDALMKAGDNNKPFYGELPPAIPKINDTWFKIDEIENTITGVFKWDGIIWKEIPLDYNALKVGELSAITAKLGDVESGSITGAEFIHNINYRDEEGNLFTGTVTMNDDGFNAATVLPTGAGSTILKSDVTTLGGVKVAQQLMDHNVSGELKEAMLRGDSLDFSKEGQTTLSVNADSFYKTSWKDLPLNAGYSTAEFNTPQYMILCIFGIRIVFFRGQVQKSTAWASANAFASVPLEIQTTRTAMAYAPTSKSTGGRVHASSANAMSFMPADTSVTYFALNQLFYVLD
ncbi:phage tail spike protein [Listeria monocytogenes]|uniref:phage tail spike protein n=1 Tax=Listeria monocytogenes TaxID=1639 RepID=UPI00074D64C2|nr:phage tail spike protein [Listeria monocytogenes]MBO8971488.1 phage tail protein [Listeria monocytogenes]CUL14377.1 Phage minor structural protein, N-terminal region domain protein [Listeria monocytogenes]